MNSLLGASRDLDKLGANQRLFYKSLIAKAEAIRAEYGKNEKERSA